VIAKVAVEEHAVEHAPARPQPGAELVHPIAHSARYSGQRLGGVDVGLRNRGQLAAEWGQLGVAHGAHECLEFVEAAQLSVDCDRADLDDLHLLLGHGLVARAGRLEIDDHDRASALTQPLQELAPQVADPLAFERPRTSRVSRSPEAVQSASAEYGSLLGAARRPRSPVRTTANFADPCSTLAWIQPQSGSAAARWEGR